MAGERKMNEKIHQLEKFRLLLTGLKRH